MENGNGKSSTIEQIAPIEDSNDLSGSHASAHGQPEVTEMSTADEIDQGKRGWFAYLRTRNFYIVLMLGSVIRNQ